MWLFSTIDLITHGTYSDVAECNNAANCSQATGPAECLPSYRAMLPWQRHDSKRQSQGCSYSIAYQRLEVTTGSTPRSRRPRGCAQMHGVRENVGAAPRVCVSCAPCLIGAGDRGAQTPCLRNTHSRRS